MVKVLPSRRNSSGDCSMAPQSTARVQTDVLASPCPPVPGVATRRATLGGWPREDLTTRGQRSTGASANCDRNVACVARAIVIGPLELQLRVAALQATKNAAPLARPRRRLRSVAETEAPLVEFLEDVRPLARELAVVLIRRSLPGRLRV
jgi:hypothetical protein